VIILSWLVGPLEAAVVALANRFRRPRLILIAARAEYRCGLSRSAKRLYRTLLDYVSAPGAPRPFWRWRQIQFEHERCKFTLGEESAFDPLHFVKIEPVRGAPRSTAAETIGTYGIAVNFRKLVVRGSVSAARGASSAETLEFTIDGHIIRRQAIKIADRAATFSFSIKRPVLEHFPRSGVFAVKTTNGKLLTFRNADAVRLFVPHGDDSLSSVIAERGQINKKGTISPSAEELSAHRERLLDLYTRANAIFESRVGRPLILMFGTLLGHMRSGDFIPGDDDFDVGYLSAAGSASEVKAESRLIMETLIDAGLTIILNRAGKPFRIIDPNCESDVHLDVCPIWNEGGYLYAPPFGYLSMRIDDLSPPQRSTFRGISVLLPNNAARFLEAYYGSNWKIPDPTYSFSFGSLPPEAQRTLKSVRFTPDEVVAFKTRIDESRSSNSKAGLFSSRMIFDLYPLDEYVRHCGW